MTISDEKQVFSPPVTPSLPLLAAAAAGAAAAAAARGEDATTPELRGERECFWAAEGGGEVTSHVLMMALLSIRLMNSKPKYLAPRTRASSSGLEADSITCAGGKDGGSVVRGEWKLVGLGWV